MEREITGWHSPSLNKHMDIAVYGHFGTALLMIPTAARGFLEYEERGMIEHIRPQIEAGKFKVYCVESIDGESYLNEHIHGHEQGARLQHYYEYMIREVLPFIRDTTSPETPVITVGAAMGALHAVNLFFKHPDIIQGVIAMSGNYDLSTYTRGYYDDNVYFNSPAHYLRNLNAEWHLDLYRQSRHIYLLSGSGENENPDSARHISEMLNSKRVLHELDIWGEDMPHDWYTWNKMLPYYLETRF